MIDMTSKYWIPFTKKLDISEQIFNYYINGGVDKQIRAVAEWLGSQECIDAYTLNRQNLEKYLQNSNLHKELNNIIHENVGNSEEYVQKFYEQGAEKGCKDIKQIFRFTKADKEALYHLKQYNFELIKNLNEDLKDSIKTTLTEGILAGADARELGAQINELPITPIGNISPRARANMIARTEYSRALNTGNLQSYANYGISEVEVITAGDAYVCDLCLDMEEKNPFPVDYEDLPPFHPNCRCTVAPVKNLEPYAAEPVENPPVINQIPNKENNKEGYDFNNKKILTPEELKKMKFSELAKYHDAEYVGLVENEIDGNFYYLFRQKYDQGRFLKIYIQDSCKRDYKKVHVNEVINEVFKVPSSAKRETDAIWFKNSQQGIRKIRGGYDILDDNTLGYNAENNPENFHMIGKEGVGHEIILNPDFFKKGLHLRNKNVDKIWQMLLHHEFSHSLDLTRERFEKDVKYLEEYGPIWDMKSNKVTSSDEWKKLSAKYARKGFTWYANTSEDECFAEHMGYISMMEANPKFQNRKIRIQKGRKSITYEQYKKEYKDMYEFCIKKLKR